MLIRRYTKRDEPAFFTMLRDAGEDWSEYYGETGYAKYARAMETSAAYLLCSGDELCGYARCREDDGFGVYVYDLLVRKPYRGHRYGSLLMERVREDFPNQTAYVMSDVDGYYEKLGYPRIGSIFEVK